MSKFDSIRPYYDEEVNEVLKTVVADPNVINAVLSFGGYKVIKKLPFASTIISFLLKNKIKFVFFDKRKGDPVKSIADITKINTQFKWNVKYSNINKLCKYFLNE